MDISGICLNCFSQRGGYDICPYCGYAAGTIPAEAYVLHPGMRLWGRYIIGTVLGAGGFGITYRVWDTRLNTMLAIKEFFPQSLVSRIPGKMDVYVFSGEKQQSYTSQLARFIEEAKNMAKFTGDAYIVSVLDYFEDNGTAYIVMEYLDGVTLKEYMALQGGSLPAQQAVSIGAALLKALTTIHQKNIIHRDISPDNIFVLQDGSIKVLDFGAARFAANEGSDLSQSIVVKKGYAPPEQYRNNMKQGVWTDIYAAGATLYKMITGITPDESIERTEKDVLKRPSQTVKVLDASVDKTLMKAMALRPELRFKSAEAMLAALENRTVIDFPEEELKKRKKRSRILGFVSTLLLVTMAGLVAWKAAQPPQTIITGTAIVEKQIEADTISILVYMYDEDKYNDKIKATKQLIAAFKEQYPQHTVNIENYTYKNQDEYEEFRLELATRLATKDGPTLFGMYVAENTYKADLSPLYASLNADDYLFLAEYGADEAEKNDGKITNVPMGFNTMFAFANIAAAKERGMQVPAAIDSWEQLIKWEREVPGTTEISYNLAALIELLLPDIGKNKDFGELKKYVMEYIQMCKQGYFNSLGYSNDSEDITDVIDFEEKLKGGPVFKFVDTGVKGQRLSQQSNGAQTLPILSEGKIKCSPCATYSVSAQATENQQKLAMLFLRFMLSEKGQNILHVQNDESLPLQKTTLEQYALVNPEVSLLTTGEYADKLTESNYTIDGLFEINNMISRGATIEEFEAYLHEEYVVKHGWK